MAIFRHTPDNYIYIDGLIMPLSFFVTQEAAYAIPAGATWQEYSQSNYRIVSDGVTSSYYAIPWTDGDSYITNKSTYETNYNAYLAAAALPQTLADAKIYQINLMEQYWTAQRALGALQDTIIYPSNSNNRDNLKVNLDYWTRVGNQLNGYYVYDIDGNKLFPNNSDLTGIVNTLDNLYWSSQNTRDDHAAAINALGTINDVLTYDYTTGWPIMPYNINLTFYASYATSINADYAGGTATGTAHGGAAISDGYLDLAHGDARYVDYSATSNADEKQIGTKVITVKPNYSGTPATDMVFLTICKADNDATNLIQLIHKATSGNLIAVLKDSSNVSIAAINFGVWNPTSGTDYEILFHFDITAGSNFIKIDHVQFGSIDTSTGTRDANIGLLRVGSGYNSGAAETSNFKVKLLYDYSV